VIDNLDRQESAAGGHRRCWGHVTTQWSDRGRLPEPSSPDLRLIRRSSNVALVGP